MRDKRIVVFAFNAPYFLDATDISKLTAYYCLYSKSAPFVEVAARLLFRELSPAGSLPVSVAGIGYDLFTATTPDPNQVIGLSIDLSPIPASTTLATPETTPTPSFRVGDTVTVRTSIILDHNGHPVPDGTGVRFNILLSGEGGVVQQIDAVTLQGLAGASFSIDRPGLLEIRAESDPALTSVVLQLNVSAEGFSVTVVAPTPNISPTPTVEATVTPEATPSSPLAQGYPGLGGWFGMMLILGGSERFRFLACQAVQCHALGTAHGIMHGCRWVAGVYLSGSAPARSDSLHSKEWMAGDDGDCFSGCSSRVWSRLYLEAGCLRDQRSNQTDDQQTNRYPESKPAPVSLL